MQGNSATIGSASVSTTTQAKLAAFVSTCANANANDDRLTWVAHPGVRETLQARSSIGTAGLPIWYDNKVCGKPALVTTNMSSGYIALGDFSKMIVAFFGDESVPVQIIVDPFSQSREGKIRFVCNVFADAGLLVPSAFCRASDQVA